MNITLSDRVKTLFQRFTEVKLENIVVDAKECAGLEPDDESWTRIFRVKDWKLKITVLTAEHQENCPHADNGDHLSYQEPCAECEPTPHLLHFSISHKKKCIAMVNWALTVTQETVTTWIHSLPTEWKMCRCGEILRLYPSPKNDTCERCYIHSYHRSEEQGGNCCICHENDDRWVRFTCGHEIHWHCYGIMTDWGQKNMRCPLCREAISNNVVDPYDV
ncbi:hypothetical protein EBT25_11070 [bacterium]|nr:hypothetical protein [bacterium]